VYQGESEYFSPTVHRFHYPYSFKQPLQQFFTSGFTLYFRYNRVVCLTDSSRYEVNLGLLDFGAFYTVILTQVRDRVQFLVNVFLLLVLYCTV